MHTLYFKYIILCTKQKITILTSMAPSLAPSIKLSPQKSLITTKQLISKKPNTKTTLSAKLTDDSPIPKPESESKSHKISWFSSAIIKVPKEVWVKRKRRYMGKIRLVIILMLHVLAMFAPFTFNWDAFYVALILHVVTGMLGVTLSFHRNLTHRSFTLPKWLEYLFAYFGSLAFQDEPIEWVKAHRYHHKYVDSERDPHSPLDGFWHSHINWLFDTESLADKRGGPSMVKDLESQMFYKFIRNTYMLHHIALGLLLYAFGGFSYVVWGMGVRIICGLHVTFCVNSVCHVWGNQAWNTNDLSKNNLWVALMTGGEGWHNNHHAFEYSARQGLEWWQIDTTWYCIRFLEVIGLAKDVKLPTQAHKQRMAFKTDKALD